LLRELNVDPRMTGAIVRTAQVVVVSAVGDTYLVRCQSANRVNEAFTIELRKEMVRSIKWLE
jgi:hypothetical protein